jgi:hypothetical protein
MIRILEYTWLIVSLFGLSVICYKIVKHDDTTQIGFFVLFTIIAMVMYLIRRRQRINMQRTRTEDPNDNYH